MFSLSKSVSRLKSLSKNRKSGDDVSGDPPLKKKAKKAKKSPKPDVGSIDPKTGLAKRGVVMISDFPIGFYEKQMSEYFSQFGKVLRIRISKNKKTGKRRNYGFVEFEFEEVAKIAAQTMDNYLMFDHIVKCKFISSDELKEKPNLLKRWNKEFVTSTQIHKSLHNKNKSIEREFKLTRNRLKKVHEMESKLKESGIEYKCQVIDLPDITSLRNARKVTQKETMKESNGVPKANKPVVRPILRPIAKRTEKLAKEVNKTEKTVKIERKRRGPRRVLFPHLYKFSIIRSANKRVNPTTPSK